MGLDFHVLEPLLQDAYQSTWRDIRVLVFRFVGKALVLEGVRGMAKALFLKVSEDEVVLLVAGQTHFEIVLSL